MTASRSFGEDYLDHHCAHRPVDATFMGAQGFNHALPSAAASGEADEQKALLELLARMDAAAPAPALGERLDRQFIRGQAATAAVAAQCGLRQRNPAWYTGEAAFGIISLLLPQSAPTDRAALLARLKALPDYLADGRERLTGAGVPAAWTERARNEAAAAAAFLRVDLSRHPDWDASWATACEAAAQAFTRFGAALEGLPDRSPAIGLANLERLMRDAHGLTGSAEDAVQRAKLAFEQTSLELVEMAARIDPTRSWSQQVADLNKAGPSTPDRVIDRYRQWDRRSAVDAAALVSVETGYDLEYRWLPPCFETVAKALYFLSYRSPPALRPGGGSVYWVAPPGADDAAYLMSHTDVVVKTIHAVHHGSVGHHSQNAFARRAASPLARVAGTDCALGLAFLSSGTMVEGWACYVQDMMKEASGFYAPAETLFLKQLERRNAASVLVDVRLHTGEWTPQEAIGFYRDQAGFAAARVEAEVTRNTMLPASRLMYWLGIDQIRTLRARWRGETRDFHDQLIGYGHTPVAWAGAEMARAGLLT